MPLLTIPLFERLAWTPDILARWSRGIALACAAAGKPLTDSAFDLTPSGATPEEAYLRGSDPSWWRRRGARVLRIAQEAQELKERKIGKSAKHKYSGASAAGWDLHKQQATAAFIRSSVLFDYGSCESKPMVNVVRTAEQKVARYYTFLKGIQALAKAADLRWAMLTPTLPAEYHPNPETSKPGHRWNGVTFDQSHRILADGWKRISAAVRKHGVILTGVRTEEPMGDGTPHWHIGFLYRTDEDFYEICRAVLRQFPAGLRVRTGRPTAKKRVRFTAKQYRSLGDYEAGIFHRNTREGAQCQIDIGVPKTAEGGNDGIRSFASYLLKYIVKAVGAEDGRGKSKKDHKSIIDSGPAQKVRQHRETYGIRSIEFFGIPKGAATCWDLLRQIKLLPDGPDDMDFTPPPPAIADLARVCQRWGGRGVVEYLTRLGGLAIAPQPAMYKVKPLKVETETRYRGKGVRMVGVQLIFPDGRGEQHVFRDHHREIMRDDAAEALRVATEQDELDTIQLAGDGSAAEGRGLVQIGTITTATDNQRSAIQADLTKSHTVIAAAGSGKTTVLVGRAEYLVSQGINQRDIVITTFTREATQTIRERLASKGLDRIQVGTMHSLSGRWLHAAGVSASGFDDVIAQASAIGKQDKHILLDEAQDLSPEQWAWAEAHAKTIFAVGDFRQAIYGWRNAKRGGLLAQAEETGAQSDMFDATGRIDLAYNLRSASAIVALGNAVAQGSTLAHAVTAGGDVRCVKVRTYRAETEQLIAWAKGTTGSRAILARTNTEVARIKAELTLAGLADVPVQTIHAAKGLEWDSVALACGRRKPSETADEARETFYVAVTRARQAVFITSIGELPAILRDALETFSA